MDSYPLIPTASFEGSALSHQVRFRGVADDARAAFANVLAKLAGSRWVVGAEKAVSGDQSFYGVAELSSGRDSAIFTIAPLANFHYSDAPEYVASVSFESLPQEDAETRRQLLSTLDIIPLTEFELAEIRRQFPLTQEYARQCGSDALRGHAVFLAIHHMTDFVAMMDALVALGVNPENVTLLDKGYPYTQRHRVDGWLRDSLGLRIYTYPQRQTAVKAHIDRIERTGLQSVILDDGDRKSVV